MTFAGTAGVTERLDIFDAIRTAPSDWDDVVHGDDGTASGWRRDRFPRS
jgi:hypothetical protein